ncbi:transcriptional regulator, TetR family [Algoriphagus ornithinivorans]|uniref:Transcriptional regulator, TetR family n=1 Tax=Algoriphagus ornithinivorans TaxID=226506 RepID=A0A1I5CN82_9BACT|nr:TetR/AcrR family transcriptional regulator [Algoriphagus ornithinivorans]SFN88470.1 transcriptional regulator, TetR family [Algoriphagus ornithinivorans]
MGISDRKEREKEELKSLILSAAKKLFLQKGIEKTSIRNIADQIEYSPGIIYHYFRDKNEIFHALHQGGFQALMNKMMVLENVRHPLERLKAMGSIYIRFAIENPDMYDLMFIKEAPIDHVYDSEHDDWKEGSGTFDYLRLTVKECLEKGYFQGHQAEPLSFLIWSTVHGMVSLHIRKRCEVIQLEDRATIVDQSLEAFFKILDKI